MDDLWSVCMSPLTVNFRINNESNFQAGHYRDTVITVRSKR